jgi:hypothetical protein
MLATVALEYGLDPMMGELMVYQGRPFVTLDARRRKAQETKTLDGVDTRPATPEEYAARRIPEEDYLHRCEVRVKDAAHPFIGWGRVRSAETNGSRHLPIVNDPQFMAEKRAESHALRRAFHLPLPSVEEIVEGEWAAETPQRAPKAPDMPDKLWDSQEAKPPITQESGNGGPRLHDLYVDMGWLTDAMSDLGRTPERMIEYLSSHYKVPKRDNLETTVRQLDQMDQLDFHNTVQEKLKALQPAASE